MGEDQRPLDPKAAATSPRQPANSTTANKDEATGTQAAHQRRSRLERLVVVLTVLAFYAALFFGGHWVSVCAEAFLLQHGVSTTSQGLQWMWVAVVCLYILATALPFVPGAEIGLSLIMIFGTRILPVVYLATVMALLLAFAVGRLVPERLLIRLFSRLGMDRTAALLHGLSGLQDVERIGHLLKIVPAGWTAWVIRNRFWGLALLINLPGNSLLGGGGGIAVTVGISRLVSFPMFVLCVAIAVSPVPLVMLLVGGLTSK
jgi:hypothetical protein